jgi:hypothetical protein
MKTLVLLLSVLVMQWSLLFGQDQKKYIKVEFKEGSELTGYKWSVQISVGGMLEGPSNKLEKALINAGYNRSIKSIFSNDLISYPHSRGHIGYSVGLNRWLNKYFTIGLNFNKNKVETTGYNGFNFIFFDYGIASFSPLVKFTPAEFLFLGAGPIFSVISQNQYGQKINSNNTFGLALYSSLRFNKNTRRMFGFIDLNYFLQGSEQVGPYIDDSPLHLDFPASKINFSYGYVGVGLGLRL